MTDSEFEKRRKKRNVALAIALAAFVALFFVVTVVKLQGLSQ